MLKSFKIQKKVANVGFEYKNELKCLEKVIEEANELKVEIKKKNKIKIKEEIGDLIFASLDVFSKEPLVKSHIFWTHPNITVTPHIASITVIDSAIEQMYKRFLEYKKAGKIINDVNLKEGY